MQELIAKRDELFDLLETELKKCESSGVQLAENEAKYRMKLRLAILDERMNGTPVSIISDLCARLSKPSTSTSSASKRLTTISPAFGAAGEGARYEHQQSTFFREPDQRRRA